MNEFQTLEYPSSSTFFNEQMDKFRTLEYPSLSTAGYPHKFQRADGHISNTWIPVVVDCWIPAQTSTSRWTNFKHLNTNFKHLNTCRRRLLSSLSPLINTTPEYPLTLKNTDMKHPLSCDRIYPPVDRLLFKTKDPPADRLLKPKTRQRTACRKTCQQTACPETHQRTACWNQRPVNGPLVERPTKNCQRTACRKTHQGWG